MTSAVCSTMKRFCYDRVLLSHIFTKLLHIACCQVIRAMGSMGRAMGTFTWLQETVDPCCQVIRGTTVSGGRELVTILFMACCQVIRAMDCTSQSLQYQSRMTLGMESVGTISLLIGGILQMRNLPENGLGGQDQRPPRVHLIDELVLMRTLNDLYETHRGEIVLDTYGLYDAPIGMRSTTITELEDIRIRAAIRHLWRDYAEMYGTLAFFVRPQPQSISSRSASFHCVFVVRFVDPLLNLPLSWTSVLVDQRIMSPSGQGFTAIRTAAFLDQQTSIVDVFHVVRLSGSCFPHGIRICKVRWRGQDFEYPSNLRPTSGEYIVVEVSNLEQHFLNTDFFFTGARRFALDGQRQFATTTGRHRDVIWIWTHAVNEYNKPLSYRVMTIVIQDLLAPERLWNRVMELWRDNRPPRSATIVHVIPQPNQDSGGLNRLHIILSFKNFEGLTPVLILGQMEVESGAFARHELQWIAKHCPTTLRDQEVVQCSGLDDFMHSTNTEFVLKHGDIYIDAGATLTIQPGSLLTVRIFISSLLSVVRRLWSVLAEHMHDDEHMLLQTAMHRKYPVRSTFDVLSPPGNGAIVDLRKDLDWLDDFSQHSWGACIFDFEGNAKSDVTNMVLEIPLLSDLAEKLHGEVPESAPVDLLHRHIHLFEEDIQPHVRQLCFGDHPQPSVLHIYTDGSFDGSKPGESHVGWGFAAFVCGDGGYQLEHLAYGCILDDYCPVVHGISVPLNARTGETEALLQATIWSLTHLGYYPVELYYDAISVGHGGTGQWNFPGGDKHSRALRALIQYAEQFHDRGFLGRHVKAHTGVLGNEVANFLANYGRTSQQVCGISQIDLGTFLTGDRMPLEWLWMQLVPQSHLDESYPAISPGTLTAKGLTTDPDVDKVFPAQLKEKAQSDSKLTYANFFVATYNVGSLQRTRGQDDHTGMCPQEYLRRQAQSHGISCLMLQETRARTSGMILSDTHIRLIAASQNGSGGTEIWLAKRSSTGGALGIKQSDVLVLLSEPELLCVRVQWPYGLFLLISAHGPHSGYPKQDIEQWWQRLSSIVDRFHTDINAWLVVGIDANTNFEDDFLPHQGGHGLAHHSNPICKHFRTFLQRHDLFLPSTFDDCHQGVTDTWRVNAERKGARCDYVCLPLAWTSSKMTSQNLPNLDAGTSTFDHMAVGVWCQLSFHKRRRPKSGFDTNKISSQLAAHGHELIPPLLDIPWTCDVHQHAAQFSDITTDWLRQHCGVEKSQPRAAYISSSTWRLRDQRLEVARWIRHLHDFEALHRTRMAVVAWRMQRTYAEVAEDVFNLTWDIERMKRRLYGLVRWSRSMLKRSLRADRTGYLEDVAFQATNDHPGALFKHLRTVGIRGKNKRSPIQPLPCLRNLNGELVTTFQQWSEVWRQQFEKQEDGHKRTRQDLLSLCIANQLWDRNVDVPVTWDQIPTLVDLEMSLRQTNTGKAYFDDGVPGELLHYGAHSLAPALYPLLLKQWLFHREALLFKGGILVPAYKKGDPTDTSNYRSLLVSPTLAKTFHRLLRKDVMGHFERQALPLQLGGRPGIAVSQASQSLHLFLHHQKCLHKPAAVIFVDIRNAFYRLFRQHLVRQPVLPEAVRTLFEELDLPEAAYDDFRQQLYGNTATEDAHIPQYLQSQIKEVLNSTWFLVTGSDEVTEARRGSRPGDSMADLLFTIAFRHLLSKFQDTLRQEGVFTELWWSGRREPIAMDDCLQRQEVLGPIWADDLAIMLAADNSPILMQRVGKVAGVLIDILLVHGMQPNLKPSKSEVFVDLRGEGSVDCRRKIHEDDYKLHTTSEYLSEPLRIVGSYKHLGTWIQTNGKVVKELRCRFGAAHQTITKYKGAIFGNRAMAMHKKVQLFNTLVLSAVLYNSPTWMITRKHDVQRLHSGIMKLYRRVTMGHLGPITQKWSDEKVQASLELPDPLDLLHVHRLRYVQHLYRAGDAIVWATLQQHPYWWQMLDKSLEWLRRHTLRTLPVESCLERWDLWEPWLQGNGRAWRSIVRQAMVHSALQIRKESLRQDFHRQVCHIVLEAQVYVLPMDVGEWDQHACPRCKMVFKSCAAWSVHAFRKHGRRTPARQFASGRSCDYCLKIFHDHMGLVNHLKNNPSCYWQYSTRGEVVQPEPSLGSAAEIKARAELRCPVTYAVGPQLPQQIVSDPIPTEDQHALLRAWREAIAGFEVETIHTEEVREALRIATLETCLPPFEILYVAKSLRLQMQKDGEIIFGVGIHRGFTRFINEFTVEWLLGASSKPTVELRDPQEVLQRWRQCEQRHQVVPKPLRFKQILVAHLFSGRRRPDDFQEWATREVWADQRFGIVPLSVDIIFSEEWGNLSNPRTFSWFVDAVTSQQLVAILAGPPCETWSIARERGLYADDGPKPLRSSSSLSGFVGLTNRETRQLCTGNELLGVAITLATHLWLAGGICIIEHPSEPKPEHAPSIWRTESMQFLLAHRENKRTLVHQGYFGAKSAKPTEFMMTNAPSSVSQIFRCNQVRFDLPTYVSIGVDEHGKYATSSLKEYPPALNRALWQVVSTQLRGRGFSEHPEDCPEGVLRNFSKLHALLDYDVKEMGPDYHPTTLN